VCGTHGEVLVAARVALTDIERASCSLELHIVPSENRPGQLSLRRLPGDATWWPVFYAMMEAGFKPGDVVRLSLVRRGDL